MTALTREKLAGKPFLDRKNYPYGFSRSGDFSITESQALMKHGALIAALVDGELTPESEEEEGYIAAATGQRPPQTVAERAWLRYQQRINRPKAASIYGSRKVVEMADDDDNDDNSDLGADIDDD